MVGTEAGVGSIRNAVLVAIAAFLAFVIVGIRYGPPSIVGDELDYYSTLYGWGIVQLIRAGCKGRAGRLFPAGRVMSHTRSAVNGTYDAQHFWFMRSLRRPFFRLCQATGLDWKHSSTFLNARFRTCGGVTYRLFRLPGTAILLAGTVSLRCWLTI